MKCENANSDADFLVGDRAVAVVAVVLDPANVHDADGAVGRRRPGGDGVLEDDEERLIERPDLATDGEDVGVVARYLCHGAVGGVVGVAPPDSAVEEKLHLVGRPEDAEGVKAG